MWATLGKVKEVGEAEEDSDGIQTRGSRSGRRAITRGQEELKDQEEKEVCQWGG